MLPIVNAARVSPDRSPMATPRTSMSPGLSTMPMMKTHPMKARTAARTFLLVILSPNRKNASTSMK